MLKLIIRQANWGILGSIFAFAIGFFVKIYVIDIVGISNWGKYVSELSTLNLCNNFSILYTL